MANRTKVFIVDQDYKADYKVFFVEREGQEKNAQLISAAVLVDKDYQADVKVFITDADYKADIKMMRKRLAVK
jgi:dUTPase